MSSDSTGLAALERFFEKLALLPPPKPPTPNLFSVAGPGHHENRLSDLMAFFMGGYPGAPRWLAKAVLHALACKDRFDHEHLQRIDWNTVTTEREVGSWNVESESTKRLDLVISGNDFVLGIEHKVFSLADKNPFNSYDDLLNRYEAQVYKCVLRPNDFEKDIPKCAKEAGWRVLSYSELLESAYELYGKYVAPNNQTKWQIFYQELLQHLYAIAHPQEAKTMTEEELNFSLKHFSDLYEASQRLEKFEQELMAEGKKCVAKALPDDDIETSSKPILLEGQRRVWRFYPKGWRGEDGTRNSCMCLVYYPTSESEGNESIGFEIWVYLKRQQVQEGDASWLNNVKQEFLKATPVAENKHEHPGCTWYIDSKQDAVLKGNYLDLGVWPREYTKAGAMQALGDLAKWVDENAFPKGS